MKLLANISLRLGVTVLMTALCLLIGGIWVGTKVTTDYLLYKNATATASNWAHLLAETVTDLEQIAAGEKPTRASMTLFEWAQKAGQVFRYEIYNPEGYSQLVSDHKVTQVNLSTFSAEAVRALATNRPIVDVRAGARAGSRNSTRWPMCRSLSTGVASRSLQPTWTRPRIMTFSTARR